MRILALSLQNIYTEKVIADFTHYRESKGCVTVAVAAEQIPVKINVKTVVQQNNEQEAYELMVFGRYQKTESASFLRYDEVLEEGTVTTTVKITDEGALILRSGALKMRMTFQENQTMPGTYQSPYGIMQTEAITKQLEHSFNPLTNEGNLNLLYDLNIQGTKAGTYHLKITYKEESK